MRTCVIRPQSVLISVCKKWIETVTFSLFSSHQTFCDIKDLSYGKETVPISCVNGIDRNYPDYVDYSNQRIPAKGVHLNLDEDFLVGCDCTDNCRVGHVNSCGLATPCGGIKLRQHWLR